ncbi:KICSTOR complex protein ITFG2-like [Limulus polyphemus]|uniref:KICSTOR complex protein ITFG2-like n=1 Tax=Limulus polyphemus TaxID=6850 RepID=A0ABM1C471_LIMPO|nr:KICSTOR complex protein ITFG2-like [Limulus polyphemus]XP_013793838.1 KICSTOR complex protein ITFG2-like [Limulus polyphemus]XP_022237220.1 KICSTOR complex protein ITFG2-like [Limulus polyphemus]
MRAVSFVDRIQFQFNGNICKDAIALADVDNDGCHELTVGNVQGDLAIFRETANWPWAVASDLGMISSITVGDVVNEKKNFLICISGEGWCNIFNVPPKRDFPQEEQKKKLQPFHTQRIPANTKSCLLADIDGDGEVELVICLTDRVLRTYRWVKLPHSSSSDFKGKLVGLHKWEFPNQIGGISINTTPEGSTFLLAAQPGGSYVKLECSASLLDTADENLENSSIASKLTPECHPLASCRTQNPSISCEIIGGVCGTRDGQHVTSLLSIATLDGTLMLVDQDEILWALQVDHQLFCLTKLDIIRDGKEEIIACAWDGQTYIVNQDCQSVRFHFEEPVCTFTAGYYSISLNQTVPCFVYATFSNRLYLYHGVQLPAIRTTNLFEVMKQDPEQETMLNLLDIDKTNISSQQALYHWCLYGEPTELNTEVKEEGNIT